MVELTQTPSMPADLRAILAQGGGLAAGGIERGGELGLSPLAGGALNASSLAPVAPTGAPTGGQVGAGANVSAAPGAPAGTAQSPGGGAPGLGGSMAGLLGGLVGNLPAAQQGRFQTQWQALDQAAPGDQLDFWSQLLGGGAGGNKRILDAILARGQTGSI